MRRVRVSKQLRYFHCPVCHSKMTAPKSAGNASGKKHRKMMYCYSCKCPQNFIMDDSVMLRY